MKMRVGIACLALSGLLSMGTPAAASLVGLDVPAELLVLRGGLQWAWVSPCAPEQPSCGATLEMHHDFRIAATPDWVASFVSMQDVYDAFHPVGGQLCASGYFNSGYSHCDSVNIVGDPVAWNAPEAWGSRNAGYSESFVVRGGAAGVPEPGSSLLLLGMGLVGLRAWRKR
jgi:hypothetical protein